MKARQQSHPGRKTPPSLVELVQLCSAEDGHKTAYTFLADGESEADSLTYSQLDRSAKQIAARLQERVRPGERTLLIYGPGLEFVSAFFGCLYAGVIAVPVYPPRKNAFEKFVSILDDSGAVAALTTGDMRRQIASMSLQVDRLKSFTWLESDQATEHAGGSGPVSNWRPGNVALEDIAFLQYTSGSTAMPKGVIVNYGSLVQHLEVIRRAYGGIHGQETFVSWLPMYHDMGLIGNVLQSAYMAAHCVLMPPVAFVQNPIRWLNALSRYRGSVSGGPNFGYELCLQKITVAQKEELDLKSWKIAFNGSEPVRSDTLARFSESFAPCGFRKEFLFASYGMAEAILLISCTKPLETPACKAFASSALEENLAVEATAEEKDARLLSSCGSGYPGQKIRVVDPETLVPLPPGRVGEIWIANSSLAQGYWNRPQETEASFHARLAVNDEGPFLRTGDLGFLYQEELYVTGRLKDLIIINGRNHYPQDIELTLEQCHPALQPGGSCAFSVEIEGEERLVVVQEVKRTALSRLDIDAVVENIRSEVARQHEVEVYAVKLVIPGTVPKTSSGKLQRRRCRQVFLAGSLETVSKRKSKATPPLFVEKAGPCPVGSGNGKPVRFSLFYFSANEAEFQQDKYRLLLEGARFADQHGFDAVWVPERHFHAFGGIYPNPSVLASALAMITQRIRIRAGSVVLPLHNPIRIAEEWSVVDNLSGGRVDLALARGWNPNDFVLSPSNHGRSRQVLFEGLETLRRLWKGDSITVPNGEGKETEVRVYPLPRQKELALWITCSGPEERFVEAGEGGWNVLTALLFQSIEELGKKIAAYREARARRGYDPDQGHVTLMLHTYLGSDQEEVRRKVREPFIEYLKTSVDLWRHGSKDLADLTGKEQEDALSFAFERYYRSSALFGTPETCLPTVEALQSVGVNEIACLIDFGVDVPSVLDSLAPLTRLKDLSGAANIDEPGVQGRPVSVPSASDALLEPLASRRIGISPSLARQPGDPEREEESAWDPRASDNRELLRWSRQIITAVIADATATRPEAIDPTKSFLSLGISSVKAVQIIGRLETRFGLRLPPPLLFEFPTIVQFAEQLVRTHKQHLMSLPSLSQGQEQIRGEAEDARKSDLLATGKILPCAVHPVTDAIAVIGLSCRFPEAPGPAGLWDILVQGRDVVTEVPGDHWDWRAVFDSNPDAENKTYSRWGGFLRDIGLFDAAFFNVSPREAKLLDPQQRLFLEVAWEALEDASYPPESLANQQVGVFVGASYNGYYQKIVAGLKQSDHSAGVGNQNAVIANRVSFAFNLHGPSVLVDTLCSSSLVALHLACQSLRSGECSAALAGGVNILLSPENYVAMSRMKAHSPDGRCKPFDHRANGIVFGEGAGALLLKPLRSALVDGDNIWAVIRGSAVNHGGQANGLLAPNPQAQAQVVRQAIEAAGISASSISYVEAHGTGTALGDPIEVEGLTKAFLVDTERRQFCRIGSVKSNIGHLEAAAGIAGIIKVILAMRHRLLPATLHFEKANPMIAFEKSPFVVNTELCAWDSTEPRRAGVSSFGIGGSNAHVILEEPPVTERQSAATDRPGHVLTLSAKSKTALEAKARQYSGFLQASRQVDAGDLCFTANVGRSHFRHRLAVSAYSVTEFQNKLQQFGAGQPGEGAFAGHLETGEPPTLAFLFTGQGAQYAGMARRLYETESTFREAMDRCDTLARPWLQQPLLKALYSPDIEERFLREPILTHTALFSLEAALVALWRSWGVVPDVVIGHSLGEYAAAYVAGVCTLEDGLGLVAQRAQLMQEHCAQPGAMVAVYAEEGAVQEGMQPWGEQIAVAAFNGPQNIVVSGEETTIQNFTKAMKAKDVACKRLKVTHAFHCPLVDPVLQPFAQAAKRVAFQTPRIPLVSTLTGRTVEKGEVPAADYWCRQMREPVRFVEGLRSASQQGCSIFLEVGPSASLASMAKRCLEAKHLCLPSLTAGQDDWRVLLATLARMYAQGVKIDWAGFDQKYKRRRISLPTYPFERKYFWLDGARVEGFGDHREAGAQTAIAGDQSHGRGVASHGASGPTGSSPARRKDGILGLLRSALARFLEMPEREIDNHKSLLEMGSDSLVFIEAIQAIQHTFSIKITLRQLFEELTTLDLLANHLDSNLPATAVFAGWPPVAEAPSLPEPALSPACADNLPSAAVAENTANDPASSVERVIAQQLAAMQRLAEQQLAALREVAVRSPVPTETRPARPDVLSSPADRVDATIAAMQPWVPFQPWNPGVMDELPPGQQEYLRKFIAAYVERTKESKRLTQEHRAHHADLRAAMSFRLCTKEIRYPIIGSRSAGSELWDVDGNHYIDFTMGYGVNLFGHNPAFVVRAIEEQLEKGIHLGPQSDIAGEVADLIHELTGMERTTFCNSGTEAVMAALRVARTTTGRNKVAIFAGSYHGTSDGVLVSARMVDGAFQAAPMVPGVPPGMVEDLVVLHYGSARSLEILEKNIDQFAAVLVEPVQSRKPDLQPAKFLRQVREITKRAGALLVFDETITGFRVHPRGAQGWFDVEADLATYGKIIGGGMPIGVLAGRAEVMAAIDGGVWQFGDSSVPGAQTTLYTGTFCKHPLAMAAARATLQEIKRLGPALFTGLNERTTELVRRLNACCQQAGVPIEVVQFGSLFRLGGALQLFSADALDLLFYHLIHEGVYVWEGRNWFLSTAHTNEDLDFLVNVMERTLHPLQDAGFLAGSGFAAARNQGAPHGAVAEEAAAPRSCSEAQKDLFLLSQGDPAASLSYNLSLSLGLRGPLQMQALHGALEGVATRHEALRTIFKEGGEFYEVRSRVEIDFQHVEMAGAADAEQDWLQSEAQAPFDLTQKPPWRARLLTTGPQNHVLLLTVHHLIADGWSMGVLLYEIASQYTAAVEQRQLALPQPLQNSDYQTFFKTQLAGPQLALAESHWFQELHGVGAWSLPLDRCRTRSHQGGRVQAVLDPTLQAHWSALSSQLGATSFMTLLTVYQILLRQLTGQQDVVVLVPVAGQAQMDDAHLIGDCSNLMAVRSRWSEEMTFADCVKAVKSYMLNAQGYEFYPLARLVRKLGTVQDPGRWPFFNVDRPLSKVKFARLDAEPVLFPLLYTNFDLGLNVTLFGGQVILAFEYRSALFERTTIEQWSATFVELLRKIAADPGLSLGTLAPAPLRMSLVDDRTRTGESSSFSYVAPSTPIEGVLTSIWEQVLGLKRISVTASFFDLGGHSLLATQIISRVRESFGVQVNLEPLFLQPTIAAFARHLEGVIQNSPAGDQAKLVPVTRHGNLPLSFPQWRLWLIDQLEPENTAYNMVGAARLTGILNRSALEASFNELIRRQEALRTVFPLVEGEPTQRIEQARPLCFEHVDLSGVTEAKIPEVIRHEGQVFARQPFDLSSGPLIRVKVLEFAEKVHAVIVLVHHIVSDGWSMGILLREVGLLYRAFVAGAPSPLAALPIQFADYAVWQRGWLRGEALQRQIDYWVALLQGAPPFLNLPIDHARLRAPSFRGAHEPFAFTRESTELLRQFCRQEKISPFMALLGAFSILLSRYSGQDDFVIGTDIANRNRLETEDVVGCFVNLLPLRMTLAGDPTFRDYIQLIRKQTLDAYMHQDVPFDHLIRALRPERKLTSTPLVQVLFVLQNAPLPALETPELKMEMVPIYMETAEFELILSVDDGPEAYTGTFGYSTDLFKRERIGSMISHLQTLLDQLVSGPERRLSSFSLFSQKDRTEFADAGLTQKELDKLLLRLGASSSSS
jgi:natural product biosynthesis luciferase-like monooxygenase protein